MARPFRLGQMRHRVAFDVKVKSPDGSGGESVTWSEVFTAWAEFRYQRGGESVQGGGLTGTAQFKVRINSHTASRALTAEHRMRDTRRGVAYNIREVDAVTDPANVWLVVESGVAI